MGCAPDGRSRERTVTRMTQWGHGSATGPSDWRSPGPDPRGAHHLPATTGCSRWAPVEIAADAGRGFPSDTAPADRRNTPARTGPARPSRTGRTRSFWRIEMTAGSTPAGRCAPRPDASGRQGRHTSRAGRRPARSRRGRQDVGSHVSESVPAVAYAVNRAGGLVVSVGGVVVSVDGAVVVLWAGGSSWCPRRRRRGVRRRGRRRIGRRGRRRVGRGGGRARTDRPRPARARRTDDELLLDELRLLDELDELVDVLVIDGTVVAIDGVPR